jgi:hypothetical protein
MKGIVPDDSVGDDARLHFSQQHVYPRSDVHRLQIFVNNGNGRKQINAAKTSVMPPAASFVQKRRCLGDDYAIDLGYY